jgi:hypothetical protein
VMAKFYRSTANGEVAIIYRTTAIREVALFYRSTVIREVAIFYKSTVIREVAIFYKSSHQRVRVSSIWGRLSPWCLLNDDLSMKLFGNFKHEAIWYIPEEGKKLRSKQEV